MTNTVKIDGSWGEGGGQILRTSLTMGILTQKDFHITKIRANRSKPGLSHQHLAAINAATQISQSKVEGAELRSEELIFFPGKAEAGKYFFQVNTAGAMTLVLHTVFLPLAFLEEGSEIELKGGTHVPWAPCYEYIQHVWGAVFKTLGIEMEIELKQAGFYPKGGGIFTVRFPSISKINPLDLLERPKLKKLQVLSILSNLPKHIAERELKTFQRQIGHLGLGDFLETEICEYPAFDPGNLLFLNAQFENGFCAGFTSLGKRGKTAEQVAKSLAKDFQKYHKKKQPVEEHLADQLLLPLIFSKETSQFCVSKITNHLLTNAHIIQLFCDAKIEIEGKEGESGKVTIQPCSLKIR